MAVHDFNAAALRAYKKRQRKGAFEVLSADSPLIAAATSDPEVEVIDIDWLGEILRQLSPEQQRVLRIASETAARQQYGTPNLSQICFMGYRFLRHLEKVGMLDEWRQKP